MPSKQFKITILIDSATVPDKDPQFLKHSQKPTTEYYVIQTIRKLGHNVTIIPVDSLKTLAKQLKEQKSSLVFNLTEEFKGDRRKDIVITSLLENIKIPFTGAGTVGLTICRDKILSKQILSQHQIKVPDFLLFPRGKIVKTPKTIKFPMVVKPAFEDGSEGISNASIVNNIEALKKRVKFVTKKWKQAAIAEEFIKGREFYVGIIGNKKLTPLPIRECIFNWIRHFDKVQCRQAHHKQNKGPCLATYRVKWNEKYRKKWNVRFGFAKSAGGYLTALDKEITGEIYETCKKAYKLLHLRDYGRIDLRLTPAGKIVILEVNANPDVAKGEDLAEAAKKAGISYEKFIEKIIFEAIARKN